MSAQAAPRARRHGPLASQAAVAKEPAPFPSITMEAPVETGFVDWRRRLTANLSRRSDGRWAPLTWTHGESAVPIATIDASAPAAPFSTPSAVARSAHTPRRDGPLRDAFPALVTEWEAYWEQQPWHQARGDDPSGVVREVLRAMLDAAMGAHDPQRTLERLLRAAVAHGERRRVEGASDEAVLDEYHALRKALWRHLLRSAPMHESITTICRVDVVITAASGLALRGFLRGRVDPGFSWERDIIRAMAEVSDGLRRALG